MDGESLLLPAVLFLGAVILLPIVAFIILGWISESDKDD